ncbi:O-antigen ligase family protein [Bacillus sp. N9]
MFIFRIKNNYHLLRNWGLIFTPKYALFLSSIFLTIGVALLAGHVFTAPAVSIYFTAILAFLVVDLLDVTQSSYKQKLI